MKRLNAREREGDGNGILGCGLQADLHGWPRGAVATSYEACPTGKVA